MTTLTIDDLGRVSCEIHDSQGELHSYALALTTPEAAAWCCELKRADKDEAYVVTKERSGRWHCTCADYTFRGYRKRMAQACKHVLASKALRALCRMIENNFKTSPKETLTNGIRESNQETGQVTAGSDRSGW